MFFPPVVYPAGEHPLDVDSGDLDGDGNLDLVVGCRSQPGVLVFLGDGAGGLQAATSYPADDDVRGVGIGDLDQDGDLDVASLSSIGVLRALLNDGTGSLATTQSVGVTKGSQHLALGDIDQDGDLDVGITEFYQHRIRFMQNDGAANFGSMGTSALPQNGARLVISDLNADGLLDTVATVNNGDQGSTVSVLLGIGGGSFTSSIEYSVGDSCVSHLALGDFDSDGYEDLVAGRCSGVAALRGDGLGAFGPPQGISSAAWPLGSGAVPIAADFDGDGQDDIAALVPTPGDMISIFSHDPLQGWKVDGDYPVTSGGWSNSHAADLNGDGFPDLIVSDYWGNQISVLLHTAIDCDQNGIFDPAEIEDDPSLDCDLNGVHDGCDLDCDSNGVPDACDIIGDPSLDCDGNGALDSCELASSPSLDQNTNGVLDSCECFASKYCIASGNSAGAPASIGWQGSLPISNNDLTLTVTSAPPFKFGLFFYGASQAQTFLGEGMLCISTPIQRIQPVLVTDAQGAAALPIDFTSPPFNSGAFAVTPFSTWNFQFWFRDPLGGPAGFNFSDALEVLVCP